MRRSRGFTLVELLTVIVIIGLLATIAVPKLASAKRRAIAQKVIGDFNAVRLAAFDQRATATAYPASAEWGIIPRELVASLPVGFRFSSGDLDYRWRYWPAAPVSAGALPAVIGLELRSADTQLLASVRGAFGGTTFGTNTQITLVIE